MAQVKEVSLHRRAQRALDAFSPKERAKVERALSLLSDPTAADFVKANVYKLDTPDPTYLMRATPDVRILFDRRSGGVQILDVVRRDKLESFAEAAAASSRGPKRASTSTPAARRPRPKRTTDEDR